MRLNFSGVDEDEIREGVRRIGEVVREQVALFGTLTGNSPPERVSSPRPAVGEAPGARREAVEGSSEADLAKVLRLPRKRAG